MATVDRNTTDEELRDLYFDNCGWREDNDPEKAAAFSTVLRALIFRGYTSIDVNGATVALKPDEMRAEAKIAERFAQAARRGQNRVRFGGTRIFRT